MGDVSAYLIPVFLAFTVCQRLLKAAKAPNPLAWRPMPLRPTGGPNPAGCGAEVDRVAPHASPNMLREETPWLARLRPPPPPPRLGAPPRLLGRLDMRDSRARRAAAVRRASSSKFLWSFSISCASTVSRWEGSRSGGVRRRGKQRGAGRVRLAERLSADVLGLLLVE